MITNRAGRVSLSSTKNGGAFGAPSLGAIQPASKKPSSRVCKNHAWKLSKYSKTCNRCGISQERNYVSLKKGGEA